MHEAKAELRLAWAAEPKRGKLTRLPLRITTDEVIVYSPTIEEIARHRLFPRHHAAAERRPIPSTT